MSVDTGFTLFTLLAQVLSRLRKTQSRMCWWWVEGVEVALTLVEAVELELWFFKKSTSLQQAPTML
jgi:hypothetical protein